MVRGRRGFNRELNGKLWSGLHNNKTRSSEMVRCRLGGGVGQRGDEGYREFVR